MPQSIDGQQPIAWEEIGEEEPVAVENGIINAIVSPIFSIIGEIFLAIYNLGVWLGLIHPLDDGEADDDIPSVDSQGSSTSPQDGFTRPDLAAQAMYRPSVSRTDPALPPVAVVPHDAAQESPRGEDPLLSASHRLQAAAASALDGDFFDSSTVAASAQQLARALPGELRLPGGLPQGQAPGTSTSLPSTPSTFYRGFEDAPAEPQGAPLAASDLRTPDRATAGVRRPVALSPARLSRLLLEKGTSSRQEDFARAASTIFNEDMPVCVRADDIDLSRFLEICRSARDALRMIEADDQKIEALEVQIGSHADHLGEYKDCLERAPAGVMEERVAELLAIVNEFKDLPKPMSPYAEDINADVLREVDGFIVEIRQELDPSQWQEYCRLVAKRGRNAHANQMVKDQVALLLQGIVPDLG